MLFSIVTPDCGLIQAQQSCSILLTTMNNVGSKTLNNAVLTALNRLCVFTRVRGASSSGPGPVVKSWISANPGFKFNPLFQFVHF